ncbi:MAG: hypothetical protein ACTSQP_00595 [Promethearchaeota archaeon]
MSLSGLAISIGGVLIGLILINYLGFIISILGLLLILINIYYRNVQLNNISPKMFPPISLVLFWLLAVIICSIIYRSPNISAFFAFILAITLRVFNLLLHKAESLDTNDSDKRNLVLLLIALFILILTINFLPIFHIETIIGTAEKNFIVYLLIFSAILFPILTGFDIELNFEASKEKRRKLIISGLKISIVLIIIFLLALRIIPSPLQVLDGYVEFGFYVLFIPAGILFILGILTK